MKHLVTKKRNGSFRGWEVKVQKKIDLEISYGWSIGYIGRETVS